MIVTMLGTGSPLPHPDRAGPATLIQAAGLNLLVDCGRGCPCALRQRESRARLPPPGAAHAPPLRPHDRLQRSGHHAVGHVAHAVAAARGGPAGHGRLRRPDPRDAHRRHRLPRGAPRRPELGTVLRRGWKYSTARSDRAVAPLTHGVSIRCAPTDHRPVAPTIGYRFEHDGRAVVCAGDTVPCEGLDRLVDGADVYVQTVIRTDQILALGIPRLIDVCDYHSSVEQAAQTAARGNVRTLVLTHMVPAPARPQEAGVDRPGRVRTSTATSSWPRTCNRSRSEPIGGRSGRVR